MTKIKRVSKKSISVILAVLILITSLSAGMYAFAASIDPYEKLIEALNAPGVQGASWGSPQNYMTVVSDPTGDIEKAAEAFWNVAVQEAPAHTGAHGDNSSYTAHGVAEAIITRLQNDYGVTGDALAKDRIIIKNFVGQMSSNNHQQKTGSFPGEPQERTYGVKIARDIATMLLKQDKDVAKLPDALNTSVSYNWKHLRGEYADGFLSLTKHAYNYLADNGWSRAEGDVNTELPAQLKAFGAYFTNELLKTDLDKMTSEELIALVKNNQAAVDACSLWGNDDVMNHFFDKAAIKEFIGNAVTARDKQFALEIAKQIKEKMKNDPTEMEHDALAVLLNELTELNASLNQCTADAVAYALDEVGLTAEKVKAYIASVNEEKEVLELKGFKAVIDELIEATDLATASDADLTAALAVAQEQLEMISLRTPAAVMRAFKTGTQYIAEFIRDIRIEMDARKLSTEIADYYAYFNDDLLNTDLTKLSTDELIDVRLNPAVEKVAALEKYDPAAIDRVFGDKYPAVKAYVASIYETLTVRMETMLDEMLKEYSTFGKITLLNYKQVRSIANEVMQNARIMNVINASAELQEKFAKCASFLNEIQEFVNSNGYSGYVKTEMTYPVRDIMPGDIARVEGEKYAVTNEKLEEVISKIDSLMHNEQVAGLLGMEGTVSDSIKGMIADGLYTDATVNSVVTMIYPALVNLLKDLILLESPEITGQLLLDNFESLHIYVYPDTLAKVIDGNRYPEVKAALNAAGRNWEAYSAETSWGVHDKASFVDALSHSLGGLAVALKSILTDKPLKESVNLVVASADAKMPAVNLYNNAVLPLLEALECENVVPTAIYNTYTTSDDLLGAVLNPLLDFVDGLADAPISTVLDILPKLAYIMEFGMIQQVLESARLDLTVDIKVIGITVTTLNVLEVAGLSSDNIYGILTEAIPGFDGAVLSDVNLLVPMVLGLVAPDANLVLPTIDQAVLASHGEMKANVPSGRTGGVRYQLVTDKADTLLAVLRYVLPLLGDSDFLNSVFALVGSLTGSEIELSPDILAILKNIGTNPDNTIAALTELFVPQDYASKEYSYAYSEAADEAVANGEAGAVINNVAYNDIWTKEKAEYITDNLTDYIDNIMLILGGKDTMKLSELIRSAITGSLYTNETVTSLVLMIKEQLAGLGIDLAPILGLVGIDLSSWDKVTEGYNWGFEDGDKDGFAAALTEALAPLTPILATVLADRDLEVLGAVKANGYPGYKTGIIPLLENFGCNPDDIMTYDAYAAAVAEDSSVALSAILKPILNLVEEIYNDPINKVFEILPNILYFLNNGGLQVCVENTAQAVFVLLDTVRPLYSLEFSLNLDLKQIIIDALSGLEINGQPVNLKIPFLYDFNLLTVGTVTPYTSASGEKAYHLENVEKADFVTVIMRSVVELAFYEDNINTVSDLIASQAGMNNEMKKSLREVLNTFANMYHEDNGVDKILNATYVIFKYSDETTDNTITNIKDFNERWSAVFKALYESGNVDLVNFAKFADKILDMISLGFITGDGVGTNGLVDFFQRLSALFQRKIMDVSIDRTFAEIYEGKTLQLNVKINPSWAKNKDINWSTSDADVAIVENGLVTAVGTGSALISAVTVDGGFEVSCVVTVAADKSELNSAIELVFGIAGKKPEGVDESLWTELESALVRAQLVYQDEYATQTEVNEAATELLEAYDALGLYTRVNGVAVSYNGVDVDGEVLRIKVSSSKTYKSQSIQLGAIINPDNADVKSVKWSITGDEIAVDENGKCSPTGKGVGGRSGWVTVTVTDYEGNTFTDTVKLRLVKWDWQK